MGNNWGNICHNIPYKVEEGIFEKGKCMKKLLWLFEVRYVPHLETS